MLILERKGHSCLAGGKPEPHSFVLYVDQFISQLSVFLQYCHFVSQLSHITLLCNVVLKITCTTIVRGLTKVTANKYWSHPSKYRTKQYDFPFIQILFKCKFLKHKTYVLSVLHVFFPVITNTRMHK
jgi:hypothetical protein